MNYYINDNQYRIIVSIRNDIIVEHKDIKWKIRMRLEIVVRIELIRIDKIYKHYRFDRDKSSTSRLA